MKEIFHIQAFQKNCKRKNSLSNLKEDAQRVFYIRRETGLSCLFLMLAPQWLFKLHLIIIILTFRMASTCCKQTRYEITRNFVSIFLQRFVLRTIDCLCHVFGSFLGEMAFLLQPCGLALLILLTVTFKKIVSHCYNPKIYFSLNLA